MAKRLPSGEPGAIVLVNGQPRRRSDRSNDQAECVVAPGDQGLIRIYSSGNQFSAQHHKRCRAMRCDAVGVRRFASDQFGANGVAGARFGDIDVIHSVALLIAAACAGFDRGLHHGSPDL